MIDQRSHLNRSARRLRYATLLAATLIGAALLVAIWVVLAGAQGDVSALRVQDQGLHPWVTAASLVAIGLCVVLALLRLVRMLGRVESGASFGVARDLRGFASWLFLSVLAAVLLPPLLQVAMNAATGETRRVALTLEMSEALMLLITGLLFFVARLLDEAQRVAEDASQII